ncbi:hypothetical protein QJS66_18325 [Kocuria rhizophila]|nr:hypothetical protein QJS66_18325 [Kocuria rhizophila]
MDRVARPWSQAADAAGTRSRRALLRRVGHDLPGRTGRRVQRALGGPQTQSRPGRAAAPLGQLLRTPARGAPEGQALRVGARGVRDDDRRAQATCAQGGRDHRLEDAAREARDAWVVHQHGRNEAGELVLRRQVSPWYPAARRLRAAGGSAVMVG